MSVRYGNDVVLTELARQIRNQEQSIQEHLRDGYLDAAFLAAERLGKKIEAFQWRLNDIKYGRA